MKAKTFEELEAEYLAVKKRIEEDTAFVSAWEIIKQKLNQEPICSPELKEGLVTNKNISAIYFIANSSISLYKMMRADYFISNELSLFSANELIHEFKRRSVDPAPKGSGDIANLYALLIALTFKDREDVISFFNEVLDIKYEWFSEIAKHYLQNESEIPLYKSIEITDLYPSTHQYIDFDEPDINFKATPICEDCARLIFIQQAEWYFKNEKK